MTDPPLPTVDVIIAVRNEQRRIGSCLESLITQDYPAELINIFVVDNSSTDSTREVVREYPVHLLRESKSGSAAARNRAFAEGNGELIAYFDGHCIANPQWVSATAARFRDERVGGAQARIDYAATDPRVLGFIESSGLDSHDFVLDITVYGVHNVYPWMLSGNCMYRRSAVAAAGLFDEKLPACEDVDLAWKVVLSGYLLVDCPDASVVHWNDDNWQTFARKSWRQGRGSAVLARRYLRLGASNAFKPSMIWHRQRDRSLITLRYWGGYRYESARIRAGRSTALRQSRLPEVLPSTRPYFDWTGERRLQISTDVIYWPRGSSESIVIHNPTRSRIVLDGSANIIWRQIAVASSRVQTVGALVKEYGIQPDEAEEDIDDFVAELERTELIKIVDR